MCQAQDCLPLTGQAMFWHLICKCSITQHVELIPAILATLVGRDSIEARHFNFPLFTYGRYTSKRTLFGQGVPNINKINSKGTILMPDKHILEYRYKEIKSFNGLVKL